MKSKKLSNKNLEKTFSKTYYSFNNPGSFGGVSQLYRQLRDKNIQVKKNDVEKWLISQDPYTIHKPINSKHEFRRLVVPGINYLWQADLIDIKNIENENNGIKYLLTCIDVFSKFAWVECIKSKSALDVLEAFKSITKTANPKYLQTDQGSEFFNKHMKEYLKTKSITLYATDSNKKASIIERFNRTLRDKLWRYFTYIGTSKYFDILNEIVENYNNSYHRSIKDKPSNVNLKNQKQIFRNLYGYDMEEGPEDTIERFKFKVGDKVRIVKYKTLFDKGYKANWTTEIFRIDKVYPTLPPTYTLVDYNNERIKGEFYENELQKIEKQDDVYQVEYIVKTKGKKPNRQYLVKWLGYPESFNSWIHEKDYDV